MGSRASGRTRITGLIMVTAITGDRSNRLLVYLELLVIAEFYAKTALRDKRHTQDTIFQLSQWTVN